jgi:anaerobic magnesium-protoporphyrin IX monomethyl ester cyclase
MRVLLVSPSQSGVYGNLTAPDYPHLGLAYLAAILEKSAHTVNIVDIDADKVTTGKFISILREGNFGLVGITATTPTFNKAIELTRIIKDVSKTPTVLGGIHVTVTPEESIRYDSVDFIIKGEGELSILELVNYLERGGDISSIDGLYYKNNGSVKKNMDRALINNLDDLPFPARHLFNKRNYSYPDALLKPAMPIITSRGCPANCNYCNSKSIFTRKFRMRSPQNILSEIEYLIKEYGAKEIHIWDDNFTTQKMRVFQIRDEIKKKNIRVKFAFPNGLRADYVDEEVLWALKDMGTYSIVFGVESGNQNVLDRVNKNIKLEEIERAFRLARKVGLEIWGFFMIGLPGDTTDSIKDTIDFAIKLNPDVAKFHILKPFPGSEVYKEFLKHGLLLDNDYDHFGIHTPPVHRLKDLNPGDLLEWHKRAYRRFYLRPTVIVRQLFRLKSFNRLKLNISAASGVLKSIR